MDLVANSRIKTPDVRVPLLPNKFEVKATKHNTSTEKCYVMCQH